MRIRTSVYTLIGKSKSGLECFTTLNPTHIPRKAEKILFGGELYEVVGVRYIYPHTAQIKCLYIGIEE
jgi:hypothetical protein